MNKIFNFISSFSVGKIVIAIQGSLFFWVVLFWVFPMLASPFDFDYTSGELLDHILSWNEVGRIYTPITQDPYRVLNYPPLFLWLVHLVQNLGFSPLMGGRLLTLFSFVLILIILFKWLRGQGLNREGSVAIITLLAGSYPVLYPLGQMHLQIQMVMFSLLGFYLLNQPQKRWNLFLSGTVFALACFTKQTQLLSVAIAIGWLFKYHRSQLKPFLAGLLLSGTAGTWLLFGSYGLEVWRHTVTYTVGTFSISHFGSIFAHFILPWSLLAGLGIRQCVKNSEEKKKLVSWYFLGTSLGVAAVARSGSSSQYFISWSVVLIIVMAPVFKDFLETELRKIFSSRPILFLILVCHLMAANLYVICRLHDDRNDFTAIGETITQICHSVGRSASPIVVERPGLARACGKIPALHPFIMASLAEKGIWNERPFLDKLSDGSYPFLILPFDLKNTPKGYSSERWTPRMLETMARHYLPLQTAEYWTVYQYSIASSP